MDTRLIEILVCPLCKGSLQHKRSAQELICNSDKLAYPIRDGIPVMLIDEARHIVKDTLGNSGRN
ncbi:Trm112 family protein [Candidatus Vallotia tarda]|uniref:Trm112 family protein n=1 Tax=Candidatus Vallotiella hemipterorum TaxID=1177213 RepID=UPI001C1F9A18|nr:Trm112 family protein [Candidatus Vallotia tarda]